MPAQVDPTPSGGQALARPLGIGYAETGKAINAKTGKSFSYWSFAGGPGPEQPSEKLEAVQLNARGQLAYAVGAAAKQSEGRGVRLSVEAAEISG